MEAQPRGEQLDAEILDSVIEFIKLIVTLGEGIAQRLSIPAPFIKALSTLECPMAMKDLGKRMHCDPSFVTVLADMLEQRGLARREACPDDRRVKYLVLTGDGLALKDRIQTEVAARMPWSHALTEDERAQLLTLIRKMLRAESLPGLAEADSGRPDTAQAPCPAPTGRWMTS
ncbi:MAG TPA: MarR family transcriptional regulator [Streptosporangiaceae bacterium]|nr:MarR family transcriptional regulator [Streptosporangiaceae bacterium]